MKPADLYRIEKRLQNGVYKYYLIREHFSTGKKFSASHLLKRGAPPQASEIRRAAGMLGFTLEMKCIEKEAHFRTAHFQYEADSDENDIYELEKYRLLQNFVNDYIDKPDIATELTAFEDTGFSRDELKAMFETKIIPPDKTLPQIWRILNLKDVVETRKTERITLSAVNKIHVHLSCHEKKIPLSAADKTLLSKGLTNLYTRIENAGHPLEQTIFLTEKLKTCSTLSRDLQTEIYQRLSQSFGYYLPILDWESALRYAKEKNPKLEKIIRQYIAGEFVIRSGARQKNLDYFNQT